MKINIQIEDASPEELQQLFARAPEITFVPARPKIHEAFKAMQGCPDPTFEEIKREQDDTKVEKTGPISAREKPKTDTKVEKPSRKPAPKKKEKKARGNKPNKFGIPLSLWKSDKKAYSTAWAYCNAHEITYDKIEKYKAAKKAARPVKEPSGVQTGSSDGVHKMVPDIKIAGADALVDKMPEIRPPTGEAHKRVHAVVAAAAKQSVPDEFKVGAHVKQIKPYLDRKVSGIGVVTARVNGLVEVNFSGTQYYKIAPDCLEVV